jgi:hypothetical protein
MCAQIYDVWSFKKKAGPIASPVVMIEKTFEIFWNFRFFHREMYHLRRKDPDLARKWRAHINKTMRLMVTAYAQWVKTGVMKKIENPAEMRMISDVVLITSSTFLQFYESPQRPATRRAVRQGVDHVLRLLLPYYTEQGLNEVMPRLAFETTH